MGTRVANMCTIGKRINKTINEIAIGVPIKFPFLARSSTLFLAAVAGAGGLIGSLRAPGNAAWAVEDGVGSGPAAVADVWERTGTCSTPKVRLNRKHTGPFFGGSLEGSALGQSVWLW